MGSHVAWLPVPRGSSARCSLLPPGLWPLPRQGSLDRERGQEWGGDAGHVRNGARACLFFPSADVSLGFRTGIFLSSACHPDDRIVRREKGRVGKECPRVARRPALVGRPGRRPVLHSLLVKRHQATTLMPDRPHHRTHRQ